ncbi:YCF48-related protein [uncultured Paludibaculum sp.]|uniref:WD40/YVTN/BNR-like repeat-containing protein n=1 Tax=uncultured Paludibaculum sp. TaxID=1765020 RepID=UPI002AAC2BEE|nr:YCF48-related protein [uncultured Paludibaculum sp.]
MNPALLSLAVALSFLTLNAQSWVPQTSPTTASLRGVRAISDHIVWASGANGTFLRTVDGGEHWTAGQVPGAEKLDFRGIWPVNENIAYLMSAGPGPLSRIYKTEDAGAHWTLQLTQSNAKGFFDSIAFWDGHTGLILGDPVDGSAELLFTEDGGLHWNRLTTPPALPGEGAFAASNTCVFVSGRRDAWYVTGGPGAARVFRSRNSGRGWKVAAAPIRNDAPGAGIFSVAFRDDDHGVVVGGDYSKDKEARQTAAFSTDGGKTWKPSANGPAGFRSAVKYLPKARVWVATGTSGSDISRDDGRTWTKFDEGAFNALTFTRDGSTGWAVGPKGRIARYRSGNAR